MIVVTPVILEEYGVRLEPMTLDHEMGLRTAAADGELWNLWYTSVPRPDESRSYIERALRDQAEGHRMPWIVRDTASGEVIGSTSYHDIVPTIDHVEIGWTWYAARAQRTHVNTSCKRLLLSHAFDTLQCAVVGLRTDNFNFTSQRAIEALGAKKDGVIRHHHPRRDGSARDTVIYSIVAGEWPDVRRHLEGRMARHRSTGA